MDPITALFYGRAGSGKGTQVALLKEYLQKNDAAHTVLQIETGAGFRSLSTGESHTSKEVKKMVDVGGLPPVFIPVWLWTNELVAKYSGSEHLLFDGFPRRVLEAEVLDGALEFYRRTPATVIILDVSEERSLERLKLRKRADDLSDEQIQERLRWYKDDVEPTIEYYRNHAASYRVVDIDGEQSIEAVHAEVLKALQLSINS